MRPESGTPLDFYTRKVVYLVLRAAFATALAGAWLYSRLFRGASRRPAAVRSIAAVWYWPADFPSASRTRLGIWKERFEREGIRFDNFHVGRMDELVRERDGGSKTRRYWFFLKILVRRWRQFFPLARYDVVWIDRWFWPHFPLKRAWFERCLRRMVPRLVIDSSDGSDYVGAPALVLDVMSLADRITVAYKGLYDFYTPRFPDVVRFEYPIIEDGYRVRAHHRAPEQFVLGWMGSPTNFAYLKSIEGELRKAARRRPVRIVVICREKVELDIPEATISYHPYGDDYFGLIESFDIGLAPFTVDDFSTSGKIGMKHQEFLLCAVPQVCSPVGISEHVVDGEHALVARRLEDWSPAILRLMDDEALRSRLARNGRELCLRHYTVAGQWAIVRRALTVFDTPAPPSARR
ncbi:MAG: glycosyltransferase [Candidatus Rokubacteria bacterium]|nr:glycosyltransferase [Candidatus Rokubacteria bacterium]